MLHVVNKRGAFSPYLCTVFFIVLDFKVNKGWSTAVLLFLCLYVSYDKI